MKQYEQVLEQINQLLEEAQLVLAPSVDDESTLLALTIRPRDEHEAPTKLVAYGRNLYAEPAVPALNHVETESMQAWTAQWHKEQQEIFPRPEVREMPRLSNVKILTRYGVYDGVLSGLCEVDGRIGHFAVIEEHEATLRPRTFCAWHFDEVDAAAAHKQLQALKDSDWKHLVYDENGENPQYSGPSNGSPQWPRQDLREILGARAAADTAWIKQALGSAEATGSPADCRTPQGWFTYADTNLSRAQTREAELADRIELARDSLIEGWDCGYRIELPPGN